MPAVSILVSGISFLLTLWIVVPAPTLALLPLGVGAPELSPQLLGVNAIAILFALVGMRHSWLYGIALSCSVAGLIISTSPLLQVSAATARTETAMQQGLGADYLSKIPQPLQAQMRPRTFVLRDALRGIAQPQIRRTVGLQFAQPDGVALKLNVYRPVKVGKYPAIVIIYGGGWQNGTPNNDEAFSQYMAAQGYSVVAIDYRHAPRYQFPAQLEDVQTALAYIRQHADELEVDPERVAIMGRSAGAHLALLAAYQPSSLPIRAVVDYYGPVNLTEGYYDPPSPDPLDVRAVLRSLLGGTPSDRPELYHQASPINYATQQRLPLSLLVYAGRDHLVQAKFGRSLYERLQKAGNPAVWIEIPWAEHSFDAVFNGVSNQLALYYTERFLAWALKQ